MMPPVEPWECALLAGYAEDMTAPGVFDPPIMDCCSADWEIVAYLTAQNALFGAQALGIGERVYFGFVARARRDPMVYVAPVRGTMLPIEWLENARCEIIPTAAGWVAAGFYQIFASMRLNAVDELAAEGIAALLPEGASIVVIGHSLGAALATYLTRAVTLKAPHAKVFGQFFASPKPGDAEHARRFDAVVPRAFYQSHIYIRDLVPRLPPSLPLGLGYQHLTNVNLIKSGDSPVIVADNLRCAHHATTYAAMLGAPFVKPDLCVLGAKS